MGGVLISMKNIELSPDSIKYDIECDCMSVRIMDGKYEFSMEVGDVVLDFGKDLIDGNIIPLSLEIVDASVIFKCQKNSLSEKSLKNMSVQLKISKEQISIFIQLTTLFRNEKMQKTVNISDMNRLNIPDIDLAIV
ncbi:hypothetical protein MsAc7_06760 [Methanolapillus millepedarum]|uniref:DUF2283 domain-containing protein n=2 Tax=Methanolapillus millepedarum TaxID=3028296 RepID=A0AA96V273_9EURY|nr:hypothetical protein MsAc7_06760 [Methanosarcinaceae archaeon Ac7]